MGDIEKKLKKHERLGKIEKAILAVVYGAGIMFIASVAPNIIQLFPKILSKSRFNYYTKNAIGKLNDKGYIEYEKFGNNTQIVITEKGKSLLVKINLGVSLEKPKHWDGKWRVVIFDISEKKKQIRDALRMTLNSLGFLRLQNSVWIFPYDCEDYISLLKLDLEIGKEVIYMIVDSIENDESVRNFFNLSQ